jgi:CelD/BcsL family acetyltransferase involved in cellulose biosynthesis
MSGLIAQLEKAQAGAALSEKRTRVRELRFELLGHEAAAAHADAWRDLDPLESNGFREPGFALAAARHLGKPGEPLFLFVWDADKLIGLCPLQLPSRFMPWSQLRVFTHEQIPLGVPLLERGRAAEALAAILRYCRDNLPHKGGLMFPLLPQTGPTARLLRAAAASEGDAIRLFGAHERAVLSAGAGPTSGKQGLSAGRQQNLNSARKRLGALGPVKFRLLSDPDRLRGAGEEFLKLEAKGWKGRRGTALLSSPERAAFARGIIAALGTEGKLLIGRLECAGFPVAMGLVIKSGAHAFYWKTAYDEECAAYSPGMLMSSELTQALLGDARIVMTDSCAVPDHPMINRLWKERMAIADFFVALDGGRKGFFAGVAFERARRDIRNCLKTVVNKLRSEKAAVAKRFASKT